MCKLDPNIEQLYIKTIGEFVEQGRPFTGYDLTLRTREREKIRLRHEDHKAGIHEIQVLVDLVDFDTWNKELRDLNGNGLQAFLYYPDGYDISQYKPLTQVQFQPSTPSISSIPAVCATPANPVGVPLNDDDEDTDDSGGELPDGSFKLDYKNRLLVPSRFLKTIDANASDIIKIDCQVGKVVLTKADPHDPSLQFADTKIVEHGGHVRIYQKYLNASGLTGNKYQIKSDVLCCCVIINT